MLHKKILCGILCVFPLSYTAYGDAVFDLPESHGFSCYDVLNQSNLMTFSNVTSEDLGFAKPTMRFSEGLDVTGLNVQSHKFSNGVVLYDAEPNVRFELHEGRTLKKVQKSLIRGDLERGFPAFAATWIQYFWSGDAITEHVVKGKTTYKFNPKAFEVYISYDVKLPAWNWSKPPGRKTLQKWEKYSCSVVDHEKLHITPTRKYMEEFILDIPNLSADSVNDLRYQLNLRWQKAQKQISDENIRIDTTTNHGATRL